MHPTTGSYDQVLKALVQTDRGSYSDLSYMPVFRASALFYAVVGKDITTRVSFMHYWREKNKIDDVGILVTVRDGQGMKRARTYIKLTEMTCQFDVRDFLNPDENFTGSMEVEAFSSQDLKFQFPGMCVFYQTPRGISYVHTNQRVYNSTEDQARGTELNPWQTGFDVNTDLYDPFVFLVNGPAEFAGGAVDFVAINALGHESYRQVTLSPMAPYGVHDWRLSSVEGLKEFLGAQPGMCKINLPLEGVHLRLAVGNALKDGSWLSVTHTYFDAVEHRDYVDTHAIESEVYPAFIPFNLEDGLNVDIVLYPIYARSEMELSLQGFDSEGLERLCFDLESYCSPESGLRRLDIRQVLADRKTEAHPGLYVLHFSAKSQKLPARITYGLNYYVGNRLGSNISASAYLSKSWGIGKRAWRWGPMPSLNGGRTLIMLSAFSKTREERKIRTGTLTIHDRLGPVATTPFSLSGNSGLTFCAEEILALRGRSPAAGDILWYVMESPHSDLDVTGITISRDGFIGGDHGF